MPEEKDQSETWERILSMIGIPAHNRRPIVSLWCGMEFKRYDFIHQVKEDGFNVSVVWKALNGRRPSAYGFQWKYQDTEDQCTQPST